MDHTSVRRNHAQRRAAAAGPPLAGEVIVRLLIVRVVAHLAIGFSQQPGHQCAAVVRGHVGGTQVVAEEVVDIFSISANSFLASSLTDGVPSWTKYSRHLTASLG